MRIDELLKGAYKRLAFSSETAELDAQLLLSHVLGKPTSFLYTWPEKNVELVTLDQFEALLKRREKGEPVAHLIKQQAFWTLDLEVSNCTLIPRADTERLVEVTLGLVDADKPCRILDLGTGTGAIALSLAAELPRAEVVGVDLIVEAVELAKRNAKRNHLNVCFLQSGWFDALAGCESFDVIVSNPPYIDPEDEHLSQGDVRFEPRSALVSSNHGLADIQHIIKTAVSYLNPNGYLVFEHGYNQAEQVREIFREFGYHSAETFQDYGNNDRVTLGRAPA